MISVIVLLMIASMLKAAAPADVSSSETITSQLIGKDNVSSPYMVTGESMVGLLKELVDFDPEGSSIVFHRRTGKLFVKTTPKNHEVIQFVLKKIRNHKPKQILIESRIIEVNSFEGFDIGFDWNQLARGQDDDSHQLALKNQNSSGSWGEKTLSVLNELNLTYKLMTGRSAIDIKLAALEQDGKVNTLSSPKIICFNNQRANIRIEESRDYVSKITTTTVLNNNTSNTESTADVETAVEGIVLDVTPTINTDNETITLDLHPTVVELVSLETVDIGKSGDKISIPTYVRRSADTTVKVKDGGTVVLGGLMKRTQSDEVKKVPLLGDIPFIKHLFRKETTFEQKSNLIIFITAKIIDL